MKEFIIKFIVITLCLIAVISFLPLQRYEFIDKDTRCNKFTGKVEYYSHYFGKWNSKG